MASVRDLVTALLGEAFLMPFFAWNVTQCVLNGWLYKVILLVGQGGRFIRESFVFFIMAESIAGVTFMLFVVHNTVQWLITAYTGFQTSAN